VEELPSMWSGAPPAGEAAAETPCLSPPVGGGLVLVADDDEDIRETLAMMLRHLGYSVQVVADGAAALAAVLDAEVAHRLVLLDATMPRMHGLDVAARLAGRVPRPRVVLVTGATLDPARALPGVDDILVKPWTFSDLRRVVG
jgi:CheY-like chemotaxis protein